MKLLVKPVALYIGNPATMYVWNPVTGTGTTLEIPDQVPGGQGGWFYSSEDRNATIVHRGLSEPLAGDAFGGAIVGMADGANVRSHFVLIPAP